MTFSEAYDELYPREEAKQETSAEDEKMVDADASGTNEGESDAGFCKSDVELRN